MERNGSEQLNGTNEIKVEQPKTKELGMAWYDFTFARMTLTIIVLVMGIIIPREGYEHILFTLLYNVSMIIWISFTMYWMSKFLRKGVENYFIINYGMPVLSFLLSLIEVSAGDTSSFASTTVALVASLIMFFPEFIYFKKRIHLFKSVSYKDYQIMEKYCVACGSMIDGDGKLCDKCTLKRDEIKVFNICVFDENTRTMKNEKKNIDTKKFSPVKYAVNDTYYAIEKIENGKKKRIYYTKDSWDKQIETTYNGMKFFDVCIFDSNTRVLRNEKISIDTNKIPPSKYSVNDTYYAMETIENGKKKRIYYTKDKWDRQIETIVKS